MKKEKNGNYLTSILQVQLLVLVYSLIGTFSKVASNSMVSEGWRSIEFIGAIAMMVVALGVYAFFWQKILKKMELSVAYANKGIGIFWTLLWSAVLFQESITLNNIVGIIILCVGVIMVTSDE